ncbi:cationic amino acid transporter 2-like [Montipora foliosa]|uniref:cationic amino acid transporter 2-like n=1 Tax=Montipora foliosa TaxID=591990 RepID=UPI0035F20539
MSSLAKALTRKKVIDRRRLTSTPLNRCLSVFDLTTIGIGTTIGAGIYVVVIDVAREHTGPSIVISFLIAGIASILSGLCYAEFGARVPKAGSAYVYSYLTIGELCAFVIGWNMILEYVIACSSLARATSTYIDSLFGDRIKNFTLSTFGEIHTTGIAQYPDLFSMVPIFLISIVQIAGIKKTSWCMSFFTGLTLFVIVFITGVGACYAEPRNWTDNFMPYGFSGVMAGSATCFFSFVGFDVIATAGEEAQNPSRGIPISILTTIGISFLAYFGVSSVLTLMWPYSTLPEGGALSEVFALRGATWAKYIIAIGALCGLISSLLGILVSLPRMVFSMSGDGLIFKFLAKVNPRTETPVIAIVVSAVFSAILAFIFDLHDLVEMLAIGTLMAYTIVAVCVMVLRYNPENVGFIKQDDEILDSEAGVKSGADDNETQREDSPLLEVREEQHPSERTASIALVVIIISSIGFVALGALIVWGSHHLSVAKWWAILLLTVISLFLIGCTLLLIWLPQNKTPLRFTVPFVPVLPLMTVFINVLLMLNLSYLTWIRFLVWMVIGMSIYCFYGLRNSVEGERQRSQETDKNQMT